MSYAGCTGDAVPSTGTEVRQSGRKQYTYRFAGPTCLAGDVIGDYSFEKPLTEGSRVVFEDMALYTMVKTNTFNGMALPSIVFRDQEGEEHLVRTFGYEDFKNRLRKIDCFVPHKRKRKPGMR